MTAVHSLVDGWWAWMPAAVVQAALLALAAHALLSPCRLARVAGPLPARVGTVLLITLLVPGAVRDAIGSRVLASCAAALRSGTVGSDAAPSSAIEDTLPQPVTAWIADVPLSPDRIPDVIAIAVPAVWLLGVVLLVGIGAARAHRIRSRIAVPTTPAGPALDARVTRLADRMGVVPPHIRITDEGGGPAVLVPHRRTTRGSKACLLIPSWLITADARDERISLDAVVLHELAHLRHRDALHRGVRAAIRILFWFHPGVHRVARRLDVAEEIACDRRALVLLEPGERPGYRTTLLGILRRQVTPDPTGAALAFASTAAAVDARLRALDGATPTPGGASVRVAALLILLTLLAGGALAVPAALLPAPARTPGPPVIFPPHAAGCLTQRYGVLADAAASPSPAAPNQKGPDHGTLGVGGGAPGARPHGR